MKPSPEPGLLESLENPPRVEAPKDLADRIKAEIPEVLTVSPVAEQATGSGAGWAWQRLAAAIVVLVGGALLTLRLQQETPVVSPPVPPLPVESSEAPLAPLPEPSADLSSDMASASPVPVPEEVESPAPTTGRRRAPEPRHLSMQERSPSPAEAQELPAARVSLERTEDAVSKSAERSGSSPIAAPDRDLEESLSLESVERPAVPVVAQSAPVAAERRRESRASIPDATPVLEKRLEAPSRLPRPASPLAEARGLDGERFESQVSRADPRPPGARILPPQPPPPIRDERPRWKSERREASPFLDPEDDALSTFGLDVDTGSYSAVRRFLEEGLLPDRDAVRTEEMINYFDYGDPRPEEEDFALIAEGAPSPFASGSRYYLARFTLTGREIELADRRPALLTFLVDTSGSMARPERLGWVRKSLQALAGKLQEGDRVALVAYGTRGRVLLEPTSDRERLLAAIHGLQAGGSTHLEDGLSLAYELTRRFYRPGETSRIILCSDGLANRGQTSARGILERVRREADEGIELSTVGFGRDSFNDELMEQLANQGDGRYAYVDSRQEAHRVFVERLSGTLETIAAEARAQVEWNPGTVGLYRLIGYENREIPDERFRDETVDAGEVGAGHSVTVLYEIKLERPVTPSELLATLRVRYRSIEEGKTVELHRELRGRDLASSWEISSPALRLASLVAEMGEILGQSYWARDGNLDEVFRRLQQLSGDFAGNREVAELVSLAGKAAAIQERGPGL